MSTALASPTRRGRVTVEVTSDDQLAPLAAVARYMKLGRTLMSEAKACALRRQAADPANVAPFVGNLTSKALFMDWFLRNRDFKRGA